MAAALASFLGEGGAPARITGLTRIFGGNARQAYAFDARLRDGRDMPCILLVQAAGNHVESDTASEYAVLRALNGSGVRAPEALALDREGAICGAPAILLERVEGEASAVRLLKEADHAKARALLRDLAAATADLHAFDIAKAGLDHDARGAALGQVAFWENSFLKHRMEPHPVLAWIFQWLKSNAPQPSRVSLVHGDLRPGNFLYQGARVTALLDWEMAHVGDPAEDIAWIYRDLWSPGRFLAIEEFLDDHSRQAGFAIPWRNMLYYRIFSEVKFATISLAAAHRFASGATLNLRHADRAAKVARCVSLALGWITDHDREARHAAA